MEQGRSRNANPNGQRPGRSHGPARHWSDQEHRIERANKSPQTPAAEWLTYSAAAERLGLAASAIDVRAGRWPIRKRSDSGEVEIEVPGILLAGNRVEEREAPDQELRSKVARAVGGVQRPKVGIEESILEKMLMVFRRLGWRLRR